MEEYVPTTTPIEKAREKLYVIGPPKKTSARYKNMWEITLFLKKTEAKIINKRLPAAKLTIGILKKYAKDIPAENDIAQYRMGRFGREGFTPPILLQLN